MLELTDKDVINKPLMFKKVKCGVWRGESKHIKKIQPLAMQIQYLKWNTLDGMESQLDAAEGHTTEHGDRVVEIIQN